MSTHNSQPGYLEMKGYTPPCTIALQPNMAEQRAFVDEQLRERGIVKTLFGLEIELGMRLMEQRSSEQKLAFEDLKKRVLQHLQQRLQACDNNLVEQQKLRDQLSKLQKFSRDESWLLYEMHEIDERTRGILMDCFGEGTDDKSYYDAPGMPEFRLKPVPSEDLGRIMRTLWHVAQELFQRYGFDHNEPFPQMAVSFFDEAGNVFDGRHKKFSTTGAGILTGVAKASFAARKTVPLTGASVGPDRSCDIRLAGEGEEARAEFRFNTPYFLDTRLMGLMDFDTIAEGIIKPGAIHGIDTAEDEMFIGLHRGIFTREGEANKIVYHALQGSCIRATDEPDAYTLIPPRDYLGNERLDDRTLVRICGDLGVPYIRGLSALEALGPRTENNNEQWLDAFFTIYMFDAEVPRDGEGEELIAKRLEFYRSCGGMGFDQVVTFLENIRLTKQGDSYAITFPQQYTVLGTQHRLPTINNIRCTGIVPTYYRTFEATKNEDRAPIETILLPHMQSDFRSGFTQLLEKNEITD